MSKAEEYIQEHTKKESNMCDWGYTTPSKEVELIQPWLTPDEAREAVKIARKEVIEKAADWIKQYVAGWNNSFIEQFRQAMEKGE